MKYLKLFESFGAFQLDEITRRQYIDIHVNREEESINYKGLQLMEQNLDEKYKLKHGGVWFRIEWVDILNGNVEIQTKIFVDKVSQYGDEPFYTLKYYYELSKGSKFTDRYNFFRFEESDFDQMCENPQILIDYLGDYFDETITQIDGAVDEAFGFSRGINPDILTREQFESLSRQSIHMRFSRETTVGLTMNVRKTDININYDSKVKQHIMFYFNYSYLDAKMVFNTKFSIMKIEGDEPYIYFDARYGYRNIGTDYTNYQKYPHDESIYGRMEVEEFDQIIKNPRLWKNWMVDKTYELDQQTHKILKESLFGVPEPELMDVNEWDEEVTNAQEIAFTQKEKELFISLSDTISVKNKIRSMPDIGKFYLYFQLINGDLNPKLKETTPISNISIYKNDDEFYFVALWTGDGLFAERELWAGGEKLYRCDGYECWEKFLKETFQGYRDLINNQTKTNESLFDVPDPELMDDNEWDDEVTNAEEVDFNQEEKELFISLSQTIPPKHRIEEIGDSQLSFSIMNGVDGTYPNLTPTTVIRSITTYKNDDEFYYVNIWEGNDSDGVHKSYRCDGYECWEKFLKEIFQGYRDLISKGNKTNESFGEPYYKEIGADDYFKAKNHRFTDSEIKELSNIAEQKGGEIQRSPGLMATIKIPRDKVTVTMIEHTSVKKVEDEFYYVAFDIMNQKKYYEADQFDGLIKLLEDIL